MNVVIKMGKLMYAKNAKDHICPLSSSSDGPVLACEGDKCPKWIPTYQFFDCKEITDLVPSEPEDDCGFCSL